MTGPMQSTLIALQSLWPVPLLAFVCAWIATWGCRRVALRWRIVDRPDQRVKTHREPVAYLGGIGILLGLAGGVLASLSVASSTEKRLYAATLVAGTLACLVGVADDRWMLRARYKILGQMLAAVAFLRVSADIQTHNFWLEALAICALIVLSSNSLNLLDGLDGLCGGVTVIMSLGFLLLAGTLASNNPVIETLCLALMGSLTGFLYFNRPPARIFMGDAGSLLLGVVVAVIITLLSRQATHLWLSCLMVMGLPLLDTGTTVARRYLNRRPLFVPDRGHLYDQIMDRGATLPQTLGICYALALLATLLGLGLSTLSLPWALTLSTLILLFAGQVVTRCGYLRIEAPRPQGANPHTGGETAQSVTVRKVHSCSH